MADFSRVAEELKTGRLIKMVQMQGLRKPDE